MLATITGMVIYSIVAVFMFFGIIGAIISISEGDSVVNVKDNSILYIKLDKVITDRSSDDFFDNFNFQTFEPDVRLGLNDILDNIKRAKSDKNINGIFMELSYIPTGISTIDEIRNALLDFKESGKFIYTYSEVMTQSTYYLASVSDKIYMNPVGIIELKGLRANVAFFKGTLQKLGVEPLIFRHGKFKSAIEPFLLDKMSDANKKQTLTYIQSIWDYIVEGIAKERGLTVKQINDIADNLSLRTVKDAVDYNIIDATKYKDEVLVELASKVSAKSVDKINFIKLNKYTNTKPINDCKDKIAIIYASGEIKQGKGDAETVGSNTITKAIRKAYNDTSVKAIVLRVNSPGGSGLASDIIWREVTLAKNRKPLIVSMGDLAASGGYYISCPADVVVANPTTLTGSIGVFGLLFNTQELMNKKLGVTFDGVGTNRFADMPNLTRKMTEAEKEIIQSSVDQFYNTFLERVAEGRGMTTEGVDKIGQGRVWSGINAKDINLIDKFGGLEMAKSIAAEKAGLTDYKVVNLPKKRDPIEEIFKNFTEDVRIKMIKTSLGNNFYFYNKINLLKDMQGIQTRMPYDVEIY
jgi:protease-4